MRLLDLYCGAGGAAKGYELAGFTEIVGVDLYPQPKYPFRFIQADALEFLEGSELKDFDLIHASPPCQAYTSASFHGKEHPDLVEATRVALIASGLPYVIENVPGSPLLSPVWLEGTLFGLKTYRRRGFECSFPIEQPQIPPRAAKQAKMGRKVREGEFIQCVGHFSDVPFGRTAMGIDWMGQKELAQAIPPAYTKFIGEAFLAQ